MGSEELKTMVPGVSDHEECSTSGDSDAPWIEELTISPSSRSKRRDELSLGSEDLNSMVVLVCHEHTITKRVMGDSSGPIEVSNSRSKSTKRVPELPVSSKDKDLVVLPIRDQNLKSRKTIQSLVHSVE